MNVEIDDRQKILKIDLKVIENLAQKLVVLSKVAIDDVVIIFVDDAGSAPINEAAVGHKGPTDVITLFYEAIPGDEEGASAEIIINVECANKQRPEAPMDEIAFYLAHAFNHLSGRDDDTPKKRTLMHRREHRWLKKILG